MDYYRWCKSTTSLPASMDSSEVKPARRTESGFTSPLLPTPAQIANIHRITRSAILPPNPSSLRATVSLAGTELARYDSEIDRLEKELARLDSERKLLVSYSDHCRSVLSALHRLPNELLAHIFDLCFPYSQYQLGKYLTPKAELRRLSHDHLLQLGQVSCRWHRIAHETPKLWSKITVNTSIWYKCRRPSKLLIDLLESALHRGGNHALDLQAGITGFREYGAPFHQLMSNTVYQLILKNAHRWRHVRIRAYDRPLSDCVFEAPGRLDNLETLDLEVRWKMLASLEAPRLRQFTFHGAANNMPDLSSGQLRRCKYYSQDRTPTLSPLSLLLNDTATFYFNFDLSSYVAEEALPSVSSDVQNIEFEVHSGDNSIAIESLFDTLTLPCLHSFKYRPSHSDPPIWSTDRFLALAHRSKFDTHLVSLSVHAKVTDEELLSSLAVLSRLERFVVVDTRGEFENVVVTDNLLRGLLYVPRTSTIVPNLRILIFRTELQFTDSLYVDLVASRVEKSRNVDGSGVFSATIRRWKGSRRLSSETREKLATFVTEGTLLFRSLLEK
ncbi:hypothetical protein R3P38DRAFT_3003902 [Favolaschia claudopus]|uniref:F-box domain-containing protein n=1 Tax=Favolaschia claudopus TaxID=2862362 RepID=A0AAW0ALL8_9AGAR